MDRIIVSASSLPAGRNMSAQLEYLQRVTNYGADMYHLDVMDGEFVKYKTIDYKYFSQLRENSPLLFETHLMVQHPEKVIKYYLQSAASIIMVHYEVFNDAKSLIKMLQKIKTANKMAGLVIDLQTDISVIDQFLPYLDIVLIMTVKAGKGGQSFDKSASEKIKYVRAKNKNILIEVDGGINDKTGAMCVNAGADILVCGSYIYNNDTYEAINTLKNLKVTKNK